MSKGEQALIKKYDQDAKIMSNKSRFGYFSIPYPHSSIKAENNIKKCKKDQDGRVTTQMRNIFSGATSNGILKKSYFSVPKSIYQGDPYDKSHSKCTNQQEVNDEHKKNSNIHMKNDRQVFKPVRIQKTLSTAAYSYSCQKPQKINPKRNRNTDGSVKVNPRNILSNSLSKLQQQSSKKFKYSSSEYDNMKNIRNKQIMTSISRRRGQAPFKAGNPVKQFFSSNVQYFNDYLIKKSAIKKNANPKYQVIKVDHEGAFRPSCRAHDQLFSYPKCLQQAEKHQIIQKISGQKDTNLHKTRPLSGPSEQQSKTKIIEEPFKMPNRIYSSKPCPSISYSKMNILRNIR